MVRQRAFLLFFFMSPISAQEAQPVHNALMYQLAIQKSMLKLPVAACKKYDGAVENYIFYRQEYLKKVAELKSQKSSVAAMICPPITYQAALDTNLADLYASDMLGCQKCIEEARDALIDMFKDRMLEFVLFGKKERDYIFDKLDMLKDCVAEFNSLGKIEQFDSAIAKYRGIVCNNHADVPACEQDILPKPSRFIGYHKFFDALSKLAELHKPLTSDTTNYENIVSEYPNKGFTKVIPSCLIEKVVANYPEVVGDKPKICLMKTDISVYYNRSLNFICIHAGSIKTSSKIEKFFKYFMPINTLYAILMHEYAHAYQEVILGNLKRLDPDLATLFSVYDEGFSYAPHENHADRQALLHMNCYKCIEDNRHAFSMIPFLGQDHMGYFSKSEFMTILNHVKRQNLLCDDHKLGKKSDAIFIV